MVGCSVIGCKSRSERKIPGITFHSFPSNPGTRAKWVSSSGKLNWTPTKRSKICSIHFDDKALIYKNKIVLLERNSVPTKHIHIKIPGTQDQHFMQQEYIFSSQPLTSQHNIINNRPSSTKRSSDVLIEIQNIQTKKKCMDIVVIADEITSDDCRPESPSDQEQQFVTQTIEPTQTCATTCKKRMRELHSLVDKVDVIVKTVNSPISTTEHEFDHFGKSVASQLKVMPLAIAIQAQQQIQNYLCELRIQNLLNSPSPQPPISHSMPSPRPGSTYSSPSPSPHFYQPPTPADNIFYSPSPSPSPDIHQPRRLVQTDDDILSKALASIHS